METMIKTGKASETRERILNAAMRLFLEEGYEKATMRKIAQAAGLTPGATYYYFATKQHIIFHYYEASYEEHLRVCRDILEAEKKLAKRISAVIRTHIEVAQPFHEVSKELFKIASDPTHDLSPFSEASRPLRDKNIAMFREVISGAEEKITPALSEKLPELLWLHKIGIILYWVHDISPQQKKTYHLINRSATIIGKLVAAYRVPMLRNFMDEMINLVGEFKPQTRN